jgi:predicted nucleic acid-binding Zn ribbon protein
VQGDHDDPVALGSAMGRLLRSLEGGRQGTQGVAAVGGVFGRWAEVVGETMAMHVQPIRLDRDRLVVQVTEPAWATQVRLLTDQIRARLREVVDVEVDHVEVRVANPGTVRRRR